MHACPQAIAKIGSQKLFCKEIQRSVRNTLQQISHTVCHTQPAAEPPPQRAATAAQRCARVYSRAAPPAPPGAAPVDSAKKPRTARPYSAGYLRPTNLGVRNKIKEF